MTEFDPTHLGLESHYNEVQQHKIRRLILEDWKKSDAKLPTYMNLLSLYIRTEDIPNDWLNKLSHQTMSKMLKSISTPRYEFWACLHLYLNKKYGDLLDIDSHKDIDDLGAMLYQFCNRNIKECQSGSYLHGNNAIKITARMGFQHIALIYQTQSKEPFSDTVYTIYEGASIRQNSEVVGLLRGLSNKELKTIEINAGDFSELVDADLQARLNRVAGDV